MLSLNTGFSNYNTTTSMFLFWWTYVFPPSAQSTWLWCWNVILTHHINRPPPRDEVLRGHGHFMYFCEIRLTPIATSQAARYETLVRKHSMLQPSLRANKPYQLRKIPSGPKTQQQQQHIVWMWFAIPILNASLHIHKYIFFHQQSTMC